MTDNDPTRLPDDLREFLEAYPTTEETLRAFAAYKTDLDRDPLFVSEYLKVQFIGDLHHAMEDAGVSQSELASRLGESRQYVSKVLKEQANFTIESMAKLACALGLGLTIRLHRLNERMEIRAKTRKQNVVSLPKPSPRKAQRASVGEEPEPYEGSGKTGKAGAPRQQAGRRKRSPGTR